jgi:hypothetical protein
MSYEHCMGVIRKAGGDLTDTEIEQLVEELQRRQRAIEATQTVIDNEDAALKAAESLAKDMKMAAVIEKVNAARNLKIKLEAVDRIQRLYSNDLAEGIEAMIVGVNKVRSGSRISASSRQTALEGRYLGGLIGDLEKHGLAKLFASGEMDKEIARALWSIDNPKASAYRGPAEAKTAAEIIRKWQEVSRMDANKAGAWIRSIDGYITRQSHDSEKIRAAGFEAWRDDVMPRLDWPRMAQERPGLDPEKFLKDVYVGLASGYHLKTQQTSPTGFVGPANLAKKMSQERVLHFKDADSWFEYNTAFGVGNMREAVLRGLRKSAQDTGLLRTFGANPDGMVKAISDTVAESIKDPAKLRKYEGDRAKIEMFMKSVDGTMNMPVDATLARVSANARGIQNMAKMGGALMSQFSDLAFYGSEMRYQGKGMLSGIAEALGGMFRGERTATQREVLSSVGVFHDAMIGTITRDVSGDHSGGTISRMQETFFKLNGMSWWTNKVKESAGLSMSNYLATLAPKGWSALGDMQRVLSLFGIDEARWNVVRGAKLVGEDGVSYLTPDAVRALPLEKFDSLIEGKASDRAREKAREELAEQVQMYLTDRINFAALRPDDKTRAYLLRGTQPGTVEGELLRHLAQFKSFSAASIQKAMGREIYGYGSDTLAEALKNGNGEMAGLANLLIFSTIFGYASMATKDLIKGRTPRDPEDPKTWVAAMAQGGGLGIYGDFLFGEMRNRMGGGLLSTVAGPTLGAVDDLADLWGRVRNGDDAAAAGFKTLINNTPYMNLFYTRAALDYLVLYNIQEALNPGAVRRMERRVEQENGQEFLIRPSSFVN